ncbi:DUF4855 domain-containing protein [Neobacillus niacini]|uniref:DUF4855 domain-containing protein n=1 Tax=Neobacillus niacini TaxID=86668 RepID=UPI002FFE1ABE
MLKKYVFIWTIIFAMMFMQFPGGSIISAKEIEVSNITDISYKNLAAGLEYTLSRSPIDPHSDAAGKELTDGLYGGVDRNNANWTGFKGVPLSVTFDLGSKKSIEKISANFLRDSANSVFYPAAITYYVSNNGNDWSVLSNQSPKNTLWGAGPAETDDTIWNAQLDGVTNYPEAYFVYARYVKVEFIPENWSLLDEIEIWGYDELKSGAVEIPYTPSTFTTPSQETTGGISDLVLLYNGNYANAQGDWTRDEIKPYVSYVDKNGKALDWLYDGVLYLAITAQSGNNLGGLTSANPSNKEDWQWYIDKTFAGNGDLEELNQAVQDAGVELNDPSHKVKVVLTVPYPNMYQTDFGDVDGDSLSENLSTYEGKQRVVTWYLNQIFSNWEEANFSHLELSGIYWMNENIENDVPFEKEIIEYTSNLVHEEQLKFFWIPNWYTNEIHEWQEVGLDAVAMQPNHFFYDNTEYRVEWGAHRAKNYGTGVEIEFDERLMTDPNYFERYLRYLNGGVQYGYMTNTFKGYYQGNDTILRAAYGERAEQRMAYDLLYEFVKGSYKPRPIIELTPSTSGATSEPIVFTVEVTLTGEGNHVESIKWAEGERDTAYFHSNGVEITNNQFTVLKNGTYSIYVKDSLGIERVRSFEVTTLIPAGYTNLVSGLAYTISPEATLDQQGLTDGVYNGSLWSGNWTKFQYTPEASIVFDLGKINTIQKINSNFSNGGYGIAFPNSITYSYSEDGLTWIPLKEVQPSRNDSTSKMTWDGTSDGVPGEEDTSAVYARYIKIDIIQDAEWTFMDEVEVWGLDGIQYLDSPVLSETTKPHGQTAGNVKVDISAKALGLGNTITEIKWANGEKDSFYFADAGNSVKLNNPYLMVQSNGIYTIYAKDSAGNEVLKTVSITNVKEK